MRITPCQGEHRMALSAPEAARLADACAEFLLAAESVPSGSLPPEMATPAPRPLP